MEKYKLAACGGTFDYFHNGHIAFLHFALTYSEKLVIGITSDIYEDVKRLHVAPFETRKQEVISFLQQEQIMDRVNIIPIDNVYGPTLSGDTQIEALIVSKETVNGADLINRRREKLGYTPFPIIVCPSIAAEDGDLISSSRIRNGEIDREGKVYIRPLWITHELVLPQSLRPLLQKPLGMVYKNALPNLSTLDREKTVTVGDVVTKLCNKEAFGQKISVVDFVVNREKKYNTFEELGFLGDEKIMRVGNKPGTISGAAFKAARVLSDNISQSKRVILKIDGEEDLIVLPLLLALPLGFVILYGQPGVGVVQLFISEETKNHARDLVSKFDL